MLSYTIEASADFDGDGIPDSTDTDDDNDGLLDTVETASGIWNGSSDTGTLPKNADTDGDGLKDGVETNTGVYVGVLDTGSNPHNSDDFDRDLLPDFYDTDDDNDTLADTVETNTGTWVSASNTGTNPKNADTDGDGLRDNVETNTGAYASATDTGTSPLVADQARVFLVGNDVLFPGGSWQVDNTNNLLAPAVGGPFNIKSITRFIGSPTNNIEFKFTGGNWDLNWGIGSNGVTALNTNTGAITGTLFKDKTPTVDDRTINVNIGRARGEYVFTFNDATNSLQFSVTRKSYANLAEYVAAYGLAPANAEGTADPDSDTLNNQAEFTANTAPDRADTDGDGVNDSDELAGTYGVATNPTLPDSDGDGLRDLWELENNLNPTVATGNDGADGDPDADSFSNILEQACGTNPNVFNTGPLSPYAKITIPGSFTGWNVAGNWENSMKLVANVSWRAMIYVSTNTMAATNRFKFAPGGSYTGSWGRGPAAGVGVKNASEDLLTTALSTNGYYQFDFNDFSGAYSITAISGGADSDADDLPDAYEAWYGSLLSPVVTDLNPATDYDGDGVTTAQEFAAGSNPVLDVAAPVITLVGDETLVLAQNGTYVDPGVTVTDDRTNAVTVTTNTAQLNPALKGVYPVIYVATDAAGNSTTNNQRFVVVGDWTDGYPSPIYYNLQILNSGTSFSRAVTNNQASTFEVYAQYYRRGATEGTNRTDAKASCWIGVTTNTNSNATNDLATGWTWTAANLNAGNNGGNDEYKVTYTNLAPGTYQVISRWQYDGGVFGYGGLNEDNQGGALGRTIPKITQTVVGGVTNSVTNQIAYLPGSITVTAVSVGYANVQWPPSGSIDTAGTFQIYAQVYSAGVTDASATAPTYAGFKAQIGFSAGNNDPTTAPNLFTWTDVTAGGWFGANGNNDEYTLVLSGTTLGAGTYYYASRFSVDGGVTWVYGGIKSDGAGGAVGDVWGSQGTGNGVLTVTSAGSTFAGWSGGATLNSSNLAKYAIGGASSLTANDGQASTVGGDATTLTLTAIVRTDDNTLTITGEASSDLGSGWSSSGVTVSDATSQAGVPQGCTRKVFSVTRGSDTKKFIRIKATKP